jgi:hypothetical protein
LSEVPLYGNGLRRHVVDESIGRMSEWSTAGGRERARERESERDRERENERERVRKRERESAREIERERARESAKERARKRESERKRDSIRREQWTTRPVKPHRGLCRSVHSISWW